MYTVELCSDSDHPLEGIGIYVYTDETQQELVWFARTDAEGKITFRDVTCEGYIAVLDGVSSDYIVEEAYQLDGEHTKIVVEAQMQSDVDLTVVSKELGDVMFDFTLTDSDGVEYTLSELLEEKDAVVLNFWYLNCGPCRQEFPYLQEAYEEYSDRIEVLALNPVDGTDETIAEFKEELELTFPMAACDPQWANAMQLTAYPTTVIIDRNGIISLIHTGSITSTKTFADAFAHFVDEDYEQDIVEDIEETETEVPGSNADDPIELGGVQSFKATVPAGGKVYYNLYRVNGTFSVSEDDVYAVYKGTTYGPKAGGFSFSIKSPDTYTPAKVTLGNSGDEDLTFTVKIAKHGGVVDNPYSVTLNKSFTTKVPKGNDQGVYYQVTAPKSGYLIFECLESPKKVAQFDYVMQNLSTNAQRTLKADGDEDGTMVSIKVKKGQKVKCWIVAEKDTSGNKYPGGTFKSKLYMSETPVKEEAEQVEKIEYKIKVKDENGDPVAKVKLNVDLGDSKPHVWTTDKKGVAGEMLEPGTYKVVMTVPSGYTATTTEVKLTKSDPKKSIKLQTIKEAEKVSYTITVLDKNGEPAEGTIVMIGTKMAITNSKGKVKFTLPEDAYTVTVSYADGTIINQSFKEGKKKMTIDLSKLMPEETEPTVTEPPVTEPSETEPPVTEPPVTEPPVTEPSVTEPSVTEPSVTEPSETEPSVTEPSETEPSATEPPVTEPPTTEPPVTEPPATEPDDNKTTYKVTVVTHSGKVQSGVVVQILEDGLPVAVKITDSKGVVSADLPTGKYKVALIFADKQMYYDAYTAVLTAKQPSLRLFVTSTAAKQPVEEWFGTTYTVGVGATYVKLQQSNVDTFFAFKPEKEGTYRISVSNSKAKLAHYGSINYPNKQDVEGATDTSYDLNVKESYIGGTYAICVTGATEYILTIERTGSAELDETDIPWEEYKGNRPKKKHTEDVSQKMTYVDLTGKTSKFKPVLGDDGYYHLNSKDGKILFVNLGVNARYISMYNMLGVSGVGGTKFGKIFRDNDGKVLVKEDYTNCMIAYITYRAPQKESKTYEFEVYPLTEDLMYMLKNGGEHMGWWDENSENFLFEDLGSEFNPKLGWMFAVCY